MAILLREVWIGSSWSAAATRPTTGKDREAPMAIRPSGAAAKPWPRWLVPGLAALALAGVGIGLAVRQNQRHQAEQTQQQQPLPRLIAALVRV